MTGSGAVIGDGKQVPTPEQVAKSIKKIVSLEGAVESQNATMALGAMLDASRSQTGRAGAGPKHDR